MEKQYLKKLSDKYEKYVIRGSGCWDWSGCKVNGGYGSVRIGYPRIYAHRISWMIHNKSLIPNGLCVLHKCDNPSCTNPQHLFLGTLKDNNLDAISKGRHSAIGKSGKDNHMTKLNPEEVLEIRDLINKGFRHTDIAVSYNISASHVSTLGKYACWRSI